MKKARILALIVAMMMMATMAVAETADDPVVVQAGDSAVLLSEAQEVFDYYYDQYTQLYAQYGMTMTNEDAATLRDAVMDVLVQQAVMDEKIIEYNLSDISDEDKEALRQEVYDQFEVDLAAYAEAVGLSVEEARESVEAEGITAELIYEQQLTNLAYTRLQEYVVEDVVVSDEDVTAEFDNYVALDKEEYEGNIADYEMATVYYGAQDIYYTPEGFRYIKHILLAIPDKLSADMIDYETDMQAAQTAIDALNEELNQAQSTDEQAEEAAEDAEPKRAVDEIQADLDAEKAKYDELHDQYEDIRGQILPELTPTIEEINEKLAGGTTFDELIAEYNTDPGMQENPQGYKVHKDSVAWETGFRDAAMALENIGDISEPVLTDFGVHIIEYAADVPSGPVEMTDSILATLQESLLTAMREEKYQTTYEGWLEEMVIETYPELIAIPELPQAENAAEDAPVEPEDTTTGDEEPSEEGNGDESTDGTVG